MPYLDTIAAPSGEGRHRLGTIHHISEGERFSIGPGSDDTIILDAVVPVSASFRIYHRMGEWFAQSVGCRDWVFVNGLGLEDGVERPLQDQDCILFSNGTAFRFLSAGSTSSVDSGLAALSRFEPSDEETWQVFADALQSEGNPLGDWVGGRPDATEDEWRRLGPLSRAARAGSVVVHWNRYGFLSRAHLRRGALGDTDERIVETAPLWHLEQLLSAPVARFLEVLELDYFLGAGHPPLALLGNALTLDQGVSDVLGSIGKSALAGSLKRLSLGYRTDASVVPSSWKSALKLCQRLPLSDSSLLPTVSGWLIRCESISAGLPLGRDVFLPTDSDEVEVGSGAHCAVRLQGANVPTVAFRLGSRQDLSCPWLRIESVPGQAEPMVNGRRQATWDVRPGDVVEPVPGVALHFQAAKG